MYSAQMSSTFGARRPAQLARSDCLAAARKLPLTSMPAKRTRDGPSRASSASNKMDVFAALPQPSSTTTLPAGAVSCHAVDAVHTHFAGIESPQGDGTQLHTNS